MLLGIHNFPNDFHVFWIFSNKSHVNSQPSDIHIYNFKNCTKGMSKALNIQPIDYIFYFKSSKYLVSII